FLDEMLRHKGLGDGTHWHKCTCCGTLYTQTMCYFRCKDCRVFEQCLDCVLARHSSMRLHQLKACAQEWSGKFWTKTSLVKLGLVYQLGHGGHTCLRPAPAMWSMVVMDMLGVHTVRYQFCRCDESDFARNLEQLMWNKRYPTTTVDPGTCAIFAALDLYRLLNMVGNINIHDFVETLERLTDTCKVSKVPDRYKAFGRMARQWVFLIHLIRVCVGNAQEGVYSTKNGECAVLCWTCPHDKINVLEGWREVAAEFQFLHILLLAIDANFRMKSCLRANKHHDPPLGDGWRHVVEGSPYKEHLKGYIMEKDVSHCLGWGTYKKGNNMSRHCAEDAVANHLFSYSNMDYILLASILGITALYLTISYNIARQWQVNLATRMEAMPEVMQLDFEKTMVLFGLPMWHTAAHERNCQVQNSLSYQAGVGRTDGEGIERMWSVLNPLAWTTKEMEEGARHDAIEDKVDHHNFEKNIRQGTWIQSWCMDFIDDT
ncbi:hypothetical protein DFH09DRAFT_946889, partial [Mycena vulgaris]